ncbi:alpha/beta hydrolase family protein [Cognatishimia sp.]|uniref:alpha/beta hydrolase family protein n=1 Tax=Cognatishimia sp. TaxID=2211648 RepID=UPI0035147201
MVSVCGALALVWYTRDLAPRHAALTDADLPDIISVRDFYADLDAEWRYKPSYDGTYVAWRGTRFTSEVTFFGRVGEAPLGYVESDGHFGWSDVSNHLHAVVDGRLWKIDPLNPDSEDWSDVTPRGFRNWNWPMRVRTTDDRWVISTRGRNPAYDDLYTTKQDGSDKQLLIKNDGKTLGWMLSQSLEPQLRYQRESEGADTVIQVPDGDGWRTVLDVPLMTTFYVLEMLPDGQSAFALSARNRDKTALVRVDLRDGSEIVVHEEPDEDIFNVINLDMFDGMIDAVLPKRGSSKVIALSPRGERLASLISTHGSRVDVDRLRWSATGDFVTASLSPEAQNYTYHLFDLQQGTQTELGVFSFRQKHLDAITLTEEVTIKSRDGLSLPALLVRPKGVRAPGPTVIEVHGGPASHVHWQYYHFRQFLANRGYSVLSVNYRGSNGFGKRFQQAGFGAFGREMQDDLLDAAQWLIDEGIADPDAIAIMGGSYGGYASAMAVTDTETPFAAAIVEHAMLDVAYQSSYPPRFWGLNTPMWTQYFGDPEKVQDLALMTEYSPVSRAESLSTPVLLVAGKRDRVVGFEQTEAFLDQIGTTPHEIDTLIFEDEGHGLWKWQSRVLHARRVEDFLHRHLGGRSGGNSLIEFAAELLE